MDLVGDGRSRVGGDGQQCVYLFFHLQPRLLPFLDLACISGYEGQSDRHVSFLAAAPSCKNNALADTCLCCVCRHHVFNDILVFAYNCGSRTRMVQTV